MIRALHTAAAGMESQQINIDVIANNLANVNTNGFKTVRADFEDLLYQTLRPAGATAAGGTQLPSGLQVGLGSRPAATSGLFTTGALQVTGNPLDVAIDGAGFFAVQTPQGVRYTRNGAFQLNAGGMLTTRAGDLVLGEGNQPIRVPPNATVQIGEDGTVLANGTRVARLLIVQGDLTKSPNGDFVGVAQPVANPRVVAGALETSNVSMVREMVTMIELIRAYETHQKIIHAHDDTLQRAINELPKI